MYGPFYVMVFKNCSFTINVSRPRKISPNTKYTLKKGSNFYLVSFLIFTKPFLCYFRINPMKKKGRRGADYPFQYFWHSGGPACLGHEKFVLSICSVNRKYIFCVDIPFSYLPAFYKNLLLKRGKIPIRQKLSRVDINCNYVCLSWNF